MISLLEIGINGLERKIYVDYQLKKNKKDLFKKIMERVYKVVTIAVALLIISTTAHTNETNSYVVDISNIDKIKGVHEDKNQLFGLFIEFLNDFINGPYGMWAQEFKDRGLDVDCPNGINEYCYWETTTLGNTKWLWGGYNENGDQYVVLDNRNGEGSNLGQEIYYDDTTKLKIYVYAKSDSSSNLVLNIYSKDRSQLLFTESVSTNTEWNKKEFTSDILTGHNKLYVEFASEENGIVCIDETSCMPDNNYMGIRQEYYQWYKEMKPGNLRYPGGEFADAEVNVIANSTGDIDKREAPAWVGKMQRMDFGYDTYFKFCDSLGITPYIVLNSNENVPNAALEIVQYCSGDTTTHGGMLRYLESGRVEPYDVGWYELGNENWDDGDEYAQQYKEMYEQIKPYSGDAVIIANGNHWAGTEWFDNIYDVNGSDMENYGWHPISHIPQLFKYTKDQARFAYMAQTYTVEYDIEWHIEHMKKRNINDVTLSLSEWWVMFAKAVDQNDNWLEDEGIYNSSVMSSIYEAAFLSTMLRYPNEVVMGSRTQGIGFFRRGENSKGDRVMYPATNYYMANLIKNNSGNIVHEPTIEQEWYHEYHYDNTWRFFHIPYCDVTITSDDKYYYLSLINRDTSRVAKINFNDSGDSRRKVEANVLDANDFFKYSTLDNPYILDIDFYQTDLTNIEVPPNTYAVYKIPLEYNSISDDGNLPEIIVYPNPSTNIIFVRNDEPNSDYTIFDIFGKSITSNVTIGKAGYDISYLSNGIYYIKNNSSGITLKFIKG